jgi:hypothetical protein
MKACMTVANATDVILSGAKDPRAKRVSPHHRPLFAGECLAALRNDDASFVNNPG